MSIRRAAVSYALRGVLNALCRIDCQEYLEALSKNKPLIVAMNHVNFLEVAICVSHSYPTPVTGVAKTETWNNPILAFLFNTYQAIPIDRNGAFHKAFPQIREAIDGGSFVCIFPEGTRSKDGVLRKGKAGIIHMALEYNVPVLPVVHYGGERIWDNIRHFKRTSFCFKAGRPFKINYEGRPSREDREVIIGEVMAQMARLLPEEMRGAYAGQTDRECKYLEFI
jgi:1-acyl-sn-glycerol-3-phosphate acyltransferase